ncbi:hypothetical protein GALL_552890 [mine drainage metagenome]|uniref:Uncharacterized protein n=1 Tax=mine drainage metagenome TaxID=410659 RepID=A0A1J5PD65_9ZZZZ
MSCDFPKLLEKHLAYDLIYRLFLWAGIALLFYYLASLANAGGGKAIVDALHSGDKSKYWNLLGPSALVVWSIGCWSKNVTLKLTDSTWGHSVGSCITSVLCKVATDMLLATFGLGASFLGYLTYYIRFEHPATAPISVNIFLGVGVVDMLGILSLLGVCIAILKAKPDSEVAKLMRKIPWKWVFSIYPAVIALMAAIVWLDG